MRSKFKWIFTLCIALSMQFAFAQEKTVTGIVSDESGPLLVRMLLLRVPKKEHKLMLMENMPLKLRQEMSDFFFLLV